MILAKKLEQTDMPPTTGVQVSEETEPSNIINLSERGLVSNSPQLHPVADSFVDHVFSPLNEW